MSSEAPRPPTPAVYRTSPLYDIYGQTLYPYINQKMAGITPYLSTPHFIQPASKKQSPESIHSLFNKFPPPTVLPLHLNLDKDHGNHL